MFRPSFFLYNVEKQVCSVYSCALSRTPPNKTIFPTSTSLQGALHLTSAFKLYLCHPRMTLTRRNMMDRWVLLPTYTRQKYTKLRCRIYDSVVWAYCFTQSSPPLCCNANQEYAQLTTLCVSIYCSLRFLPTVGDWRHSPSTSHMGQLRTQLQQQSTNTFTVIPSVSPPAYLSGCDRRRWRSCGG